MLDTYISLHKFNLNKKNAIKLLERWPSGLRRTLGKRVKGKLFHGFESHSLRQFIC